MSFGALRLRTRGFRCFTDGCSAYDGTPLSERLREAYGGPFIAPRLEGYHKGYDKGYYEG